MGQRAVFSQGSTKTSAGGITGARVHAASEEEKDIKWISVEYSHSVLRT